MRIALVANPAAGGGVDARRVQAALRTEGADARLVPDARHAAAERPDRVAVAGGDGSIAPAADAAQRLGVPLAVIPAGTANDFARANELPPALEDAARLAVRGERLRALELARLADGTPFVNVASAGLAPLAARRAAPLKSWLGPLAYALGAAGAALGGRPLPVTVRLDGEDAFAGDAWQLIVAATGAFGGGAGVGAARPGDGLLDVVVLPAGSRLALARRAWGMRRGSLERQRDVVHRRAGVVEVGLPPGTPLNVDGEVRAGGLERARAQAGAYALVVP